MGILKLKKQLFVGELTPCEEHITPVRNEMGMNKPRGGFLDFDLY